MATLILRETYRALEEEMKSIDKKKRETSVKIREAADHGDLKENAEYHAAREEQSLIVYKKQLLQSHAPFQFVDFGEIETDEDIINRVKHDIYYLENWSLILDLNIVFLTTINFLTGQKKAY